MKSKRGYMTALYMHNCYSGNSAIVIFIYSGFFTMEVHAVQVQVGMKQEIAKHRQSKGNQMSGDTFFI